MVINDEPQQDTLISNSSKILGFLFPPTHSDTGQLMGPPRI